LSLYLSILLLSGGLFCKTASRSAGGLTRRRWPPRNTCLTRRLPVVCGHRMLRNADYRICSRLTSATKTNLILVNTSGKPSIVLFSQCELVDNIVPVTYFTFLLVVKFVVLRFTWIYVHFWNFNFKCSANSSVLILEDDVCL
jgi:hypothetical protein